jgi:PAS domain S-box-containing protein
VTFKSKEPTGEKTPGRIEPGLTPLRNSPTDGRSDLLLVIDGAGSIREVSPSVAPLLSYRRGQLLGTSLIEILHPGDVPVVQSLLGDLTQAVEAPARVQMRLRQADGNWRTFEARARAVAGPNDQALLVLDACDVSPGQTDRTVELPAMKLGGPLAQVDDRVRPGDHASSDEVPSPDLIERAGARGETVLVALDDRAVSTRACTVMRLLGYVVLEAMSPADAEGFARVHKSEIHLLLADLATPRVHGREFVRSMKAILPGLKALFVSCQRYGSLAERRVFESGGRLLHEPFTPEELAHAVRRALESAE